MTRNTKRTCRNIAIAATAAALLAGLSGCVSRTSNLAMIRLNPSPAEFTLRDRAVDIRNQDTIAWDENLRMMVADFRRAAYLDRPSRLSPDPLP